MRIKGLSRRRNAHRYLTRYPWPTATPRGSNNIVHLTDAKIVAWSMRRASPLTNIFANWNIAGEDKQTWFTQSR
jgi:hypothetical protein